MHASLKSYNSILSNISFIKFGLRLHKDLKSSWEIVFICYFKYWILFPSNEEYELALSMSKNLKALSGNYHKIAVQLDKN